MSEGLYFDTNYTFAKSLADNQGDLPTTFAGEVNYGVPIANRFDIASDYGNVEGTRRQNLPVAVRRGPDISQSRRLEEWITGWMGTEHHHSGPNRAMANAEHQ